jgi:hypothetical protein
MIIPVIDTERGKFEYTGRELTNDEYGNMEYEHFKRTDRQVGRFVDNMARGISNFNPYDRRMTDVKDAEHPDIYYNDEEIQVKISDSDRKDMDEDRMMSFVDTGKMFILILDMNPDTVSEDAESELRLWMDDSGKVINDSRLPDDVKIKSLPVRDYEILAGGKWIKVMNCKMVQKYTEKNHPLKFAIIVEKATVK